MQRYTFLTPEELLRKRKYYVFSEVDTKNRQQQVEQIIIAEVYCFLKTAVSREFAQTGFHDYWVFMLIIMQLSSGTFFAYVY